MKTYGFIGAEASHSSRLHRYRLSKVGNPRGFFDRRQGLWQLGPLPARRPTTRHRAQLRRPWVCAESHTFDMSWFARRQARKQKRWPMTLWQIVVFPTSTIEYRV